MNFDSYYDPPDPPEVFKASGNSQQRRRKLRAFRVNAGLNASPWSVCHKHNKRYHENSDGCPTCYDLLISEDV